jgi:hypothetical protein
MSSSEKNTTSQHMSLQNDKTEQKRKMTIALVGALLVIAVLILGMEVASSHRTPTSPYDSKAGIEAQIKQTEDSKMSDRAKQMTIMSLRKIEAGMDAQAAAKAKY